MSSQPDPHAYIIADKCDVHDIAFPSSMTYRQKLDTTYKLDALTNCNFIFTINLSIFFTWNACMILRKMQTDAFLIYFITNTHLVQSKLSTQDVAGVSPIGIFYQEKIRREFETTIHVNNKNEKNVALYGTCRKMRTDSDFSAISVCWRFCPFSRQLLHASSFLITSQEFPQINWFENSLKQTKWPQLERTDTARL